MKCARHPNFTMTEVQLEKVKVDVCPKGCTHFDNGEVGSYVLDVFQQLGYRAPGVIVPYVPMGKQVKKNRVRDFISGWMGRKSGDDAAEQELFEPES